MTMPGGKPSPAPRVLAVPAARDLPRVSVVLPIRNEVDHIEACLKRVLEQDYPRDSIEVLVVDGCSEDGTREVVRRVQALYPSASVRLLDNPQRTVPPGLNVGIRAATGDVIVRMDGHTVPAPDYVSRCVQALLDSGAANVGGVIEAVGTTPFGHAVAAATVHRLGAGDARYRIGGVAGDVDTVPFGAFRRSVFARIGLFDESLVRNQDSELNARIRAAGERVYLDPTIRSVYTPRSSVRTLWSQYFQYGWWRFETMRRHPGSLRWRQLLPPVFFLGITVLAIAGTWLPLAATSLVLAVAAYAIVVGVVSFRVARPPATPALVAVAFAVVHVGYSLGLLVNALSGGRYPYRAGPPRIPQLGGSAAGCPTEEAS